MHVHLHVLVSWGGLNAQGQWVEPKRRCLLPRQVLMEKFRGKFLAYLRKALDKGKLVLPPDRSEAQAQSLLNELGRAVWNVKIFDPYEHGRGVATYLARYLKGGPLSNGRLLDCRDGVVRFWYRDNRDEDEAEGRGRRKILALPVDEFWRGCWSTCRRRGCRPCGRTACMPAASSRNGRWPGAAGAAGRAG